MKLGDRWINEKIDRTRENLFDSCGSFDAKTQKILDKITEIYLKDIEAKANLERRCFEYFGYSWDWIMSHPGSVIVKSDFETNKNVYWINGRPLFYIQTIFDDPEGVHIKIRPMFLERYILILEGRKNDEDPGRTC